MQSPLDALLASATVWRARDASPSATRPGIASGWPQLDACLPGGGWPLATLTELLQPRTGMGELQLVLPALRTLMDASRQGSRWLAWIGPPHIPYPPALVQAGLPLECMLWIATDSVSERLWAVEQVLRSGSCAAMLAWLGAVDDCWLRRLQLAAAASSALAVLFRPSICRAQHSPASLRILLEAGVRRADERAEGSVDLLILKRRGLGPVRVHDALRA
jgi:hypothetical protein